MEGSKTMSHQRKKRIENTLTRESNPTPDPSIPDMNEQILLLL